MNHVLKRRGAICSFVILCPVGRSANAYMFYGTVWSAILRTAAHAELTRRDPLEDESAGVQDEMGWINLFTICPMELTWVSV
ncbi:unnamed protein product [Brassica napus]|uniref:(rape) hypothetical protein n=1 Tax=Brassica napus TaxID=3708 RepID=A0A816M3P2_BRANA|nr:unnamed protein product [Brassica napus]